MLPWFVKASSPTKEDSILIIFLISSCESSLVSMVIFIFPIFIHFLVIENINFSIIDKFKYKFCSCNQKMEDSDDIFEDFEARVKSKKEGLDEHDGEFKKPHEHISEKELLKRRYENEKRALEERYEKEMGILQEKEIKVALKQKKSKTGLKKLKTITYVMIIVILLSYIIYLSFFNAEKSAEAESTQDTPISVVKTENKSNETKEAK